MAVFMEISFKCSFGFRFFENGTDWLALAQPLLFFIFEVPNSLLTLMV